MMVTPEAGTVKTNEARDVVLDPHLIDMGFLEVVKAAPRGHLSFAPPMTAMCLRRSKASRTDLRSLHARLSPTGGAPSHGWRHRFKPIGTRAGIDRRTLDEIQDMPLRADSRRWISWGVS